MTKPMMDLRALAEKRADTDLLRERIDPCGGRFTAERLAQRNGSCGPPTYSSAGDPGWQRRATDPPFAHRFLLPIMSRAPALRRDGADGGDPRQAYVHDVSTRSMDDLVQAMGRTGVSRNQVSRLCEEIDERADAFLTRPIEGSAYAPTALSLDRRHQSQGASGRADRQRCGYARHGVNTDGRREVLGMAIGASEAEPFWTEFLRDLVRRGLSGVRLVISDAHEGIKAATARVLSTT